MPSLKTLHGAKHTPWGSILSTLTDSQYKINTQASQAQTSLPPFDPVHMSPRPHVQNHCGQFSKGNTEIPHTEWPNSNTTPAPLSNSQLLMHTPASTTSRPLAAGASVEFGARGRRRSLRVHLHLRGDARVAVQRVPPALHGIVVEPLGKAEQHVLSLEGAPFPRTEAIHVLRPRAVVQLPPARQEQPHVLGLHAAARPGPPVVVRNDRVAQLAQRPHVEAHDPLVIELHAAHGRLPPGAPRHPIPTNMNRGSGAGPRPRAAPIPGGSSPRSPAGT
mmetsp:Transcript_39081/g.96185  ORF Transcript_39081/g.96185 Transcript_39081/m.96185 type:complete len:276 (-) Transcript_39081:53-880(-)